MTDAPQRPTERVAAVLRDIHGGGAHGWTRENAHALLDAALDVADGANDAEGEGGRLAHAAALFLSSAVASWTIQDERSSEQWDLLAQENPAEWREAVTERMRLTPGLLPLHAMDQLMFGLLTLDTSAPPAAILAPSPRDGHGRNPTSRRYHEQALIAWIEIEKARGRRAGEVQAMVAAAVGQSVRAVETWKREWRKRDGAEHVEQVLASARAFGRRDAIPAPVPYELVLIRLVLTARCGPMHELANGWKRARV